MGFGLFKGKKKSPVRLSNDFGMSKIKVVGPDGTTFETSAGARAIEIGARQAGIKTKRRGRTLIIGARGSLRGI